MSIQQNFSSFYRALSRLLSYVFRKCFKQIITKEHKGRFLNGYVVVI